MRKGSRTRRDIVGTRYGRLTVISDDPAATGINRRITVRCECGTEKKIQLSNLYNSNTVSCGCYSREVITKHGMTDSLTYNSWHSARLRCRNPKVAHYERYGGRGICFSDRWNDFRDFLEDMGERPKGYTLERIDSEGHYEPGNCEWAEKSQQRRNQKRQSLIGFNRFKGVHRHQGSFRAMISVHNRTVDLGTFADEVSAAKAYDKAAVTFHGGKAVTNAMLGRY